MTTPSSETAALELAHDFVDVLLGTEPSGGGGLHIVRLTGYAKDIVSAPAVSSSSN